MFELKLADLHDSMLNLMEGIIPEYDCKGKIRIQLQLFLPLLILVPLQARGPSGSLVIGIVPTNAYPCLSSPTMPSAPTYIIIGANGDTLYARLVRTLGHEASLVPIIHTSHRLKEESLTE